MSPLFSTTNHARGSMYNVQRVNVSHFCSFYSHHIFTKNNLPFCYPDIAKFSFPSLFIKVMFFDGYNLPIERLKDKNKYALREKCPYSEFFWSLFSRIQTEYGDIRSISRYSVWMRENTDHKNSKFAHLSHSYMVSSILFWFCFLRVPYIRKIKSSSLLNFLKHD